MLMVSVAQVSDSHPCFGLVFPLHRSLLLGLGNLSRKRNFSVLQQPEGCRALPEHRDKNPVVSLILKLLTEIL